MEVCVHNTFECVWQCERVCGSVSVCDSVSLC